MEIHGGSFVLLARIGSQPLDDLLDPEGSVPRGRQRRAHLRLPRHRPESLGQLLERKLEVGQRVVDLVSDSRSEPTQSDQSFRIDQLLLGVVPFGGPPHHLAREP